MLLRDGPSRLQARRVRCRGHPNFAGAHPFLCWRLVHLVVTDERQRLQRLFFPDGVAFSGKRFDPTAVTASLFEN